MLMKSVDLEGCGMQWGQFCLAVQLVCYRDQFEVNTALLTCPNHVNEKIEQRVNLKFLVKLKKNIPNGVH